MEKELQHTKQLIDFTPKVSLCFISKGRMVSVLFPDITHVSKYGNETVIYTASLNPSEGGTSYRTYYSLQDIFKDLPVNDFFRIHRSHIVSLKYMNGIKRKRIVAGEYHLPVSDYYKVQLCKRLAEILDRSLATLGMTIENYELTSPRPSPGGEGRQRTNEIMNSND